jgi:hypothetical protein
MIALWVGAGKVHSLGGITVDPDLVQLSVGLYDLNGTGIMIRTHVVGRLFLLGQRAFEVVGARLFFRHDDRFVIVGEMMSKIGGPSC